MVGWTEHSTPNLAIVQVRLRQRTLFLTSVYIEPDVDVSHTAERMDVFLKSTSDSLHVIGGDVNGHHTLWGSPVTDGRGENVVSIAASNGLGILNIGREPTFMSSAGCTSIVDVTLASESVADSITDWRVNPEACQASDHNAVEFVLTTESIRRPDHRTSTYLFNNKTAKWSKFHYVVQANMQSSGLLDVDVRSLSPSEIDEVVQWMTDAIRDACYKSMKLRGSGRPVNPWWTPELDDLKKASIQAHHRLSQVVHGRPDPACLAEAITAARTAKRTYAKAVRKTSMTSFRNFCNKQGKEDVWTLTNRLIKDAPRPQPASTLRTPDGFTRTTEETASALLHHFYPDDTSDVLDGDVRRQRFSKLSDGVDDPPFVQSEVLECLESMSPDRAPGHDNLTSDIVTEFVKDFPEFVTGLLNRCLDVGHFPTCWKDARVRIIQKPGKDDYSSLSSFRPIGLLPVFGKLLEKLFVRRMTYRAQQDRTWSGRQFGFREATSTTDALRTLVDRIRTSKRNGRQVLGVSLDIKAAFDNAWWPALMERLRRTKCPRNVHRLIRSYLDDRTVTLDFADVRTTKSMTKGCIQGSVCGPTFWNLVLDELLDVQLPDGCYVQAYADDVMLLVEGTTTSGVQASVNAALRTIHEWGRSVHLTFSPTKTQAIGFTSGVNRVRIHMDGVDVPFADEIKLLGVILDGRLTFVRHVKYVLGKVSRTFKVLCKFVRPTWGVHPENVETLYRQVIVPTITYASGIWGQAAQLESVKRMLRTFQRTFAIRCIRGFHTVSAVSASAISGFMPLHLKIQETYRIEQVKATGRFDGLPPVVRLEQRVRPDDLLHPAQRVDICSDVAMTEADVGRLSSPTNIYTDGSKLESGRTGCAFVVIHPDGRQESVQFRLDDCCSVFQSELFALDAALKWTLSDASSDVSVFTDSQSSIAAIKDRSNKHPLVNSIHRTLSLLAGRLDVRLVWVKAHVGIRGNEAADVAAKDAAESDRPSSYQFFPLSLAKHRIRTDAMDAWNQEYTSADTGSTTRSFLPSIESALRFRESVSASFETTQFLSGHGFHLSYLHRFHISSTDRCPCGLDVQDVHHLLESCPRYSSVTSDFAARCAALDVGLTDVSSIVQHPGLRDSFVDIVQTIVRTLKSFNSSSSS